jgi:hypothetical protein
MKNSERARTVKLLEQCASRDDTSREKAVTELWMVAANSPSLRPLALAGIRGATGDPEWLVRNEAIEALQEVGNRNDYRRVAQALSDKEWVVRASASSTLGKIGGKQALPHLAKVVAEDREPTVRSYAATAIGDVGDKRMVEFLEGRSALETEQRALVGVFDGLVLLGRAEYVQRLVRLIHADRHPVPGAVMNAIVYQLEHGFIPQPHRHVLSTELRQFAENGTTIEWVRNTAQELADRLEQLEKSS